MSLHGSSRQQLPRSGWTGDGWRKPGGVPITGSSPSSPELISSLDRLTLSLALMRFQARIQSHVDRTS
jgi:hypothetical protein